MEDALVRLSLKTASLWLNQVLILVLMEDALVLTSRCRERYVKPRLNPCFNGRCTRTSYAVGRLICIEHCLNPCFNGRCTRTAKLG